MQTEQITSRDNGESNIDYKK